MFKSQSYNVKKANEKSKKEQTKILKPSKKEKNKPSADDVKKMSNKSSPEYSKKNISSGDWHKNKTYSAKKEKTETKKVVIPSPKKKLERK